MTRNDKVPPLKLLTDTLLKTLQHPVVSIAAILLGVACAVYAKSFAQMCYVPGRLYLALFNMCILPVIVSAVILSMGRLLRSKSAINTGQVFFIFVAGMCLVVAVGFSAGLIFQPGSSLSLEQQTILGEEIGRAEAAINNTHAARLSILSIISQLIPENIFSALSEGKILPVLVFCIFTGIALGKIETQAATTVLEVAEAIYEAMTRVIEWLMLLLPIGLFCLFAGGLEKIGSGVFMSLFKFVVIIYAVSTLFLIIYFLVISFRSGQSFWYCVKALKKTFLVAMGTSSSLAALPFAIECFNKDLRFEKQVSGIILPLGITINLHGNILYFAVATILVAQVYNVDPSSFSWIPAGIITILVALAASSAPGISGLSIFAVLLETLGLPGVIGVILLIAIDPIVDPILTCVNVFGNCASNSMINSPVKQAEKNRVNVKDTSQGDDSLNAESSVSPSNIPTP